MTILNQYFNEANSSSVPWTDMIENIPHLNKLEETPHDKFYHNEGNVLIHTKMVVDELLNDSFYQSLSEQEKFICFWTCVFHDIGKPYTTKLEDNGRISSKGHSKRGAVDARIMLWEMGMDFDLRESICSLIRFHQEPFFILNGSNPQHKLYSLSVMTNNKLLYAISLADSRGRITVPENERQISIDNVHLFKEFAEEENCFGQSKIFANDYTRFQYFLRNGSISADYPFNETSGSNVFVLCGMPASGKNYYYDSHFSHLPVVSFDDAKAELGIKQGKNSGEAKNLVIDRAKSYLRDKQDFVWNSTNLSTDMRQKILDLLHSYHAKTNIVYLEADKSTILKRNNERDSSLSNKHLLEMLFKWEPPTLTECFNIKHHILKPNLKNKHNI